MKSQPDFAGPLGYHLATFDGQIRGENSARHSGTQALIEEPSCLASGCSDPVVSFEFLSTFRNVDLVVGLGGVFQKTVPRYRSPYMSLAFLSTCWLTKLPECRVICSGHRNPAPPNFEARLRPAGPSDLPG